MSIFASQTSVTIPMPGDDGQTITIRALTGRELETAASEHMKSMVAGRSARGWSGAFQRIIAGVATQQDAEQALADPLAGYDRTAIVRAGLIAWSYATKPAAAIDDLMDDPLEAIAREILMLTKPALFQTQEEAKATQREADAVPSFAGR